MVAIVIDNIDLTPNYVAYERPPQPLTLWSAIPRGLQSFVTFTPISAKPLNDSMVINFNATLPPNFGYVMNEANLTLNSLRSGDFDPFVNLNIQNFYRGTDLNDAVAGNWPQPFELNTSFAQNRAMAVDRQWPTSPMIGTPGTTGALVVLSIFNPSNTAMSASTASCFISFWQFDLEQIRKYPINSPLPTHAR